MTAVNADITYADFPQSSLTGTLAGYIVQAKSAQGGDTGPLAVVLGTAQVPMQLDVGDWTATITPVDASGNAVAPVITSNVLNVPAPVVALVSLPSTLTLSLAPQAAA